MEEAVKNEYHFIRLDKTDTKIIEASTLFKAYSLMLEKLGWEWIACVAENPKYSIYKLDRKEK